MPDSESPIARIGAGQTGHPISAVADIGPVPVPFSAPESIGWKGFGNASDHA